MNAVRRPGREARTSLLDAFKRGGRFYRLSFSKTLELGGGRIS